MQCEEAIRHDWFKDLLIEMDRDIEYSIQITRKIEEQYEDEDNEDGVGEKMSKSRNEYQTTVEGVEDH